jgi:hypothetical protein
MGMKQFVSPVALARAARVNVTHALRKSLLARDGTAGASYSAQ